MPAWAGEKMAEKVAKGQKPSVVWLHFQEALRTIHSFDPCLACAIHTVDAEGNEIARVKVL